MFTKKNIPIIIFILIFSVTAFTQATREEKTDGLTLEKIFKEQKFSTKENDSIQWYPFDEGFTQLEDSSARKDGEDIVYISPRTGKKKILVSAKFLIPAGEKKSLEIDSYQWSKTGDMVLIFTNTKRVWRRNTRGDYWLFHLKTKKLHQIGKDKEPSTLMFAKFSPDSQWVGYVQKNNIYAENLSTGKTVPLTSDGSISTINGTFDWVYEEELDLRDGFRWSPDSRHIAYWQLNAAGIKTFYMINNTDTLYPELIPIPYPKVGTVNPAARIGVVNLASARTQWFIFPGDSREHYLARMEWAESSSELIIQRFNRKQNTNQVMLGDISSRRYKTILKETSDTWVENNNDITWFDKGKNFLWMSERSGWRHIYQISRDGKNITPITSGEFDVIEVTGINKKTGWIYFTASPDNPTQRYLYRVNIHNPSKPRPVSPKKQKGSHSYNMSPTSRWAFHTFSNANTPPVSSLVSLPTHQVKKVINNNQKLRENIKKIKQAPVEFFRVTSDEGVTFDVWSIKPPDLDPQKKYPVLFYIYGEPAGTTVRDSWNRNIAWYWMLAHKGYIIMSVDNRGTPAPRGRAWRKSIYKKIGIISSTDQAAAARKILKERPYIDPDRIGIWGWSGGGSMSLNMIFRYPELYKTAVAVAAVPHQKLYDTIYQERYMGLISENPEAYDEGSPITYAHQLKGNLLIIHGTADDNVHFQGCQMLMNELIRHNKQFQVMPYPNEDHSIRKGENVKLHLYTLITNYLYQHLPPGPR